MNGTNRKPPSVTISMEDCETLISLGNKLLWGEINPFMVVLLTARDKALQNSQSESDRELSDAEKVRQMREERAAAGKE